MRGNADLLAVIRREIQDRGPLTFARFMELALYHPQHGYYLPHRKQIGREGDFFTSSSVGPVFGRFLAMQFVQMWEAMDKPRSFRLLELGANRMLLCEDIHRWVAEHRPDFEKAMEYWICERSWPESTRGTETIKRLANWTAIEDESIVGCIFSNELLDAFPVHLVQRQNGRWIERYVNWSEGKLCWKPGPLSFSAEALPPILSNQPFTEGYRTEVSLSGPAWLEQMARILKRGFLLTIDYGYPEADYYAPHRADGTLLCYHQHRINCDPFERVGQQDITAHVDFGMLTRNGTRLGLNVASFTDQTHFLLAIGRQEIERIIGAHPGELDAARLQLQTLLDPQGMGRTFKVLIQQKQVSLSL